MGDSVQDVYAKNLPTEFGYPLRTPEPSTNLPESYQEDGLQIGDVGYVDRYGAFHVLFNIRYSSNHALHRKHGPPTGFEPVKLDEEDVNVNPDAIAAGQFIGSPHIKYHPPEQPDERVLYRFVPSLPSGAILILPFGAIRHELNETEIEKFRKVAVRHAQSWCAVAGRDSVYLITGFHKTRSWSLGSFRNAPHDAEILVKRPSEEDASEMAKVHKWEPTFSMYWRAGPGGAQNESLNQTVFITGFKVTVRWWLSVPDVELLQRSSSTWVAFFRLSVIFFLGILESIWQRIYLKSHEHFPQLSQPFHPSDVINRYLLDKNPSVQVAVTHDSQWMRMFETEELTHDDIVNENCVWEILNEKYSSVSDQKAVYLQRKNVSGEANDHHKSVANAEVFALSSPSDGNTFVSDGGDEDRPLSKFEMFSLPTPSIDKPWIVISRIRVDNAFAGLRRLPAGFYVLVQYNGTKRRTKIRSLLVCERLIEWDDQIILSCDPSVKVQFSLCAAFEFDPMLGNGETLSTVNVMVENLVGSTTLIHLPSREGACSSFLITAERRYCPHLAVHSRYEKKNLGPEKSSAMARETDMGHAALLHYLEHYSADDLKNAIEHCEHALTDCAPDHECRPSALFNLAMAKFHRCEVSGRVNGIAQPIALYREALEMRHAPHPDRPATLLGLGQALLFRHQRRRYQEYPVDDVEKFMHEVEKTCSEGSQEHRAAILVLQKCRWLRVKYHSTLPEINELIFELDDASRVPPLDHFDRPYRLENLSLALRRRFEIQGDVGQLSDLDRAIAYQEDAIRLLHQHCPDRARQLRNLGCDFFTRFHKLDDIHDLERAIAMMEEAVQFTPEHHPDYPHRLKTLGMFLHDRFDKLGDVQDLERAIAKHEEAVRLTREGHSRRADRLDTLGSALRARFRKLGDVKDINHAIEKLEEAVRITPLNDLRRANRLDTLGSLLRARFHKLRDSKDIEQAVSRREEAVQITPKDCPERARLLQNFGATLRSRSVKLGGLHDLERAIAMGEEALRLTPEHHPAHAQRLHNLGRSFRARYDKLGDIEDLDRAITKHDEAVSLTSADHSRRAARLDSLGSALRARFHKLGDIRDIEEAIARREEAVLLTPEDCPDRSRRLHNLGSTLRTRSVKLGVFYDLGVERAIMKGDVVRLPLGAADMRTIHTISRKRLGIPDRHAQMPPSVIPASTRRNKLSAPSSFVQRRTSTIQTPAARDNWEGMGSEADDEGGWMKVEGDDADDADDEGEQMGFRFRRNDVKASAHRVKTPEPKRIVKRSTMTEKVVMTDDLTVPVNALPWDRMRKSKRREKARPLEDDLEMSHEIEYP